MTTLATREGLQTGPENEHEVLGFADVKGVQRLIAAAAYRAAEDAYGRLRLPPGKMENVLGGDEREPFGARVLRLTRGFADPSTLKQQGSDDLATFADRFYELPPTKQAALINYGIHGTRTPEGEWVPGITQATNERVAYTPGRLSVDLRQQTPQQPQLPMPKAEQVAASEDRERVVSTALSMHPMEDLSPPTRPERRRMAPPPNSLPMKNGVPAERKIWPESSPAEKASQPSSAERRLPRGVEPIKDAPPSVPTRGWEDQLVVPRGKERGRRPMLDMPPSREDVEKTKEAAQKVAIEEGLHFAIRVASLYCERRNRPQHRKGKEKKFVKRVLAMLDDMETISFNRMENPHLANMCHAISAAKDQYPSARFQWRRNRQYRALVEQLLFGKATSNGIKRHAIATISGKKHPVWQLNGADSPGYVAS